MDCKKALTNADGDMDKAVDFLREQGLAKQAKKAGRIAAEGVAYACTNDDLSVGVVVEVNAETDFVAKNDSFMDFVKACANTIIEQNPADVEALMGCKMGDTDVQGALNDLILVITTPGEADALRLIFGEQETKDWNTENIDWNSVDSQLISQRILVTRPEINGKKLSQLRLRNTYGINISRVYRSGVQLLATPDLRLQLGDRLTVVGEAQAIRNVEKILGNAVKSLNEPNLAAVFIGLILGLTLGSIPIAVPGVSIPVKLGLAGGPIIVGILIGTFGPRMHMITYTTQSANLMLRALGLSMYLACLGLDAGAHFFETVMRPEGILWLGVGFVLTFVPVVMVGLPAMRLLKVDFGSVAGLLCGSMANPMALNYANDTIEGDNPSVSYATVYPVCMFLRVIIIQVMLMLVL